MIRNNTYTFYKGKEYRIGKTVLENESIRYWIQSIDSKDLENGFQLYERPKTMVINGIEYEVPSKEKNKPNSYIKYILPLEVGEVYFVRTFGIYKNHKFRISMEKDGQYLLWTSEYDLVEKYNLDIRNQGDYEKWVKKEDVEHIYEIKKPIPDYFD